MVEVCLQQQLYDALIHVHNRGLRDYGTPLLELLLQLRVTLKKAGKNLPSETGGGGGGGGEGGVGERGRGGGEGRERGRGEGKWKTFC